MKTQTPKLIDTINVVNSKADKGILPSSGLPTKQESLPGKDRVIQTIIKKPIGESMLPAQNVVSKEIEALHNAGEDAYIILTAPIVPFTNSVKPNFEMAHDDGYKHYVVTKSELKSAGLSDIAAVRRDANALRQDARARQATKKDLYSLVA